MNGSVTRFGAALIVFVALVVGFQVPARAEPAITVKARPDAVFQALFESYGNDNSLLDDWTGADGVLSASLPDGRVVWDFSDTFLGLVNEDGSRPPGQPFINNSVIVQS